jgi:hypothetical protein
MRRKAGGRRSPLPVSFPGPGSRFASPATTITFRGIELSKLDDLAITGSVSGCHLGRLHSLRIGTGAVFTPAQPFEPGETVTVQTGVPLADSENWRYRFTVARLDFSPNGGARPTAGAPPSTRRGLGCGDERGRLRTLPEQHPTTLCVARLRRGAVGGGRLLLTPRPKIQRGPDAEWAAAILSRSGKLLWYRRFPHVVNDLNVVELDGRRLLALFHRTSPVSSYYELLDERYEHVARIAAGNGYKIDSHELQIGPRGTAFIGAYQGVLTPRNRRVTDYIVQEVDPMTGDVLFEWHALDHVPPWAGYSRELGEGYAWDYFHGNAIEPPTRRGRTLLVSSRNTSAIYGVDARSGTVRWVLGGRRDQFKLNRRSRARFCAQHDVRRAPNGDITLFDNGGTGLGDDGGCRLHPARALRLRVNPERREVRLVSAITSAKVDAEGDGYFPYATGSVRRVEGGGMLVNWGTAGHASEFASNGRVALHLDLGHWSYRAARQPWTGHPSGSPALVVQRRSNGTLDLWASWNGATEIRRWRVLAGAGEGALVPVGTARFADLETRIRVAAAGPFVAVEALGSGGRVLGRSEVVRATG